MTHTGAPFLVSADHLDRIAAHVGKRIEYHDGHGFLTAGSMTYRTIRPVGGVL
jgi:hypothetical protein